MLRTRIKICGITRPEDAANAADLGADAVGLNFFRGPRRIGFHSAKMILARIPAMVMPVGLMAYPVSTDAPSLAEVSASTGISTYQLYAEEYPVRSGHGSSQIWTIRSVTSRESLAGLAANLRRSEWIPQALLLDTAVKGQLGGTGQPFNWHWIAEARAAGELTGLPPIILAGGLTPDNVADAIRIARPYAVDVSSGVEVPGRPGIKDPAKLRDFIQAVHAADTALAD